MDPVPKVLFFARSTGPERLLLQVTSWSNDPPGGSRSSADQNQTGSGPVLRKVLPGSAPSASGLLYDWFMN